MRKILIAVFTFAFSIVNTQWSMVNGQRSMVNGQRSMVNGQWSMDISEVLAALECAGIDGCDGA